MNQEMCKKFKSADTVTAIKVRRMDWLGHVVRWMVAASVV